MRRSVYVAGIVLLALGFVLLGAGLLLNGASATETIRAGASVTLRATTLTPATISVTWHNETPTTRVFLISGTPTCSSPPGIAGKGTGANASLTASLKPGVTYSLYGCGTSTFKTVHVNYTVRGGLRSEVIVGSVAVVSGLLLVLLGSWMRTPTPSGAETDRSPPAWEVHPVASAAQLGTQVRESRRIFLRPATPALRLRGRSMITCSNCGKAYSGRKYRTCPHCASASSTPF